jgi:hypothetical protein
LQPIVLPRDEEFWRVETPRQGRARLVDALRLELLGPESPEEELRESPISRYAMGLLAPFGTGIPDEERDEELTGGGEDEEAGAVDLGPPMSQSITPSSIGLSFLIPAEIRQLTLRASWGDYRVEEIPEDEGDEAGASPGDGTEAQDGDGGDSDPSRAARRSRQRRRRRRLRWVRTPREVETLHIDLRPDDGLQQVPLTPPSGITVEHLCRTLGGQLAVSVFLVNRRDRGERLRPPVDRWIFQPSLTVRTPKNNAVFLPRELEPATAHADRDLESNRLLFRNRREFAVGHGCAAEWAAANDGQRAEMVRTELIPTYELPRVAPRPMRGPGLEMSTLASVGSAADLRAAIAPLLEDYNIWIGERQASITDLPADLRRVAESHLDDCSTALERMRRGAQMLEEFPEALSAFRFANHAMLLQRSHTIWAHARRRDRATAPPQPAHQGRWRPFQLAFILLNLPGLIDPANDDRMTGDLLWFPTGGGKTEAYLGLAAFAMSLRRLKIVPGMRTDSGVTVLMRYTLRLLTIQQFQRAATLVCACEVLRSQDPQQWGHQRFTIGLWLGMQGTPNSHDDSRRSLVRLQGDPSEEGPNPCQLESCPWCGEQLSPDDYWTDGESVRTRVACCRESCAFSKENDERGLPVLVVDEEIYRECPSMLIGTVDKFAQMPWNGDVQALFGYVDRECDMCGFLTAATAHVAAHRSSGTGGSVSSVRATERLAPPDLIIQDELHLISGPLGTLVGLYETAVDFLSSRRVGGRLIGPKVVASTATVRRAWEQVQAVFQRELKVFPPPGVDPDDSYFAVEQPVSEQTPGRLYIGVCAPGKSMKTAYIRVAASILSSTTGLRAAPTIAEPYTTIVSYFNSLRELGGAIRLMDDDIPARLDQLRTAGLPRRQRPVYVELTSRIRQEEIPHLLRRLEQRHDAPRSEEKPPPLDVVLASNMISVGVDIDRLGLMTVTGQPKTTAEYIQASSRVGRQAWGPGLVVTIYNWSRPRDLSHYERFRHYHATLYRNVEAVSATPFSSRALDRGLRGTYVSMTRLGSELLSPEDAASQFDPGDAGVPAVIQAFRRRAEAVAGAATAASVVEALRGLGDEWWGYARNPLRYGWRSPSPTNMPAEDVLLRVPEGGRLGHWPAPQSLREVEDVSLVRVLGLGGN